MMNQISRREFLVADVTGLLRSVATVEELPDVPQSTMNEAVPTSASSEPDNAGADSPSPSPVEGGPGEKLFGVLIIGAIVAFLVWSLGSLLVEGYWSWRLACDGVPVMARVIDYRPETVTHRSRRGGTHTYVFHMHRVSFDNRVETVKLKDKHTVGAEIAVLYLPEEQGLLVAARRGDSVLTIFHSRIHGNTFLWFLLWTKLVVVTVLGWLLPGQGTQGTASELIDSAGQAADGGGE